MNMPITQASPPAPDAGLRTRRVCVIANPGSGRRDGTLFRDIEARLDTAAGRSVVRVAENGRSLEQLTEAALGEDFDVIAAAGGDGTVACVASVLFHAASRGETLPHMGIIPLGTFNYVARALDLPQDDPAAAVDLLLTGTPRPMSVGEVNGRVFLNNASIGAYPAILDQREGIYKKWGRSRIAAYWSVLRALSTVAKPLSMKIDVDGIRQRKKSPLAFVANSAYQIEEFDLPGADEVRNGNFALYVAPDTGRYGMILRAIRLAGRTARLGRDMELLHGRSVTIETRQPQRLIARDGEKEEMSSPFHFNLHPDALSVIAADPGAREETGPASDA